MQRTTPQASSRRRAFAAALSSLGILLAGQSAHATTDTWVGNTSTDLANAANWDTALAPVATDDLVFATAGTSGTTLTNTLTAGLSLTGLTFNSGASAFTLGGNQLTLTSGITDNATNTETISLALALGGANAWSVGSGGTLAASGVISGANSLTKTGAGTLTLSGSNTYSGGTTISAGTVSISTNNNLGTGTISLNGGTLTTTAGITNTRAITVGASGGTINVTTTGQYYFNTANTLLGSGALTLTGNGTLTANTGNLRIAQTNTYSGNVTMQSGGIFEYGVANAVASGATFTLNNQGELAVNSGITLANNITVNGGTNSVLSFENGTTGIFSGGITLNADLTVGLRDWYNYATVRSGTISGNITGTGGLSVNSGSGSGGTLTLSGTNTYTGATTINASTLKATKVASLAGYTTSGKISVGSTGTLSVNAGGTGEFTTSDLASIRSNVTFTSGAVLGIDTTNASGAVIDSGNITNAGLGITKLGTGTLTLSGTNSHTGTTTVSAGTLQYNGTGAMSSGSALAMSTGSTVALRSDTTASFTPASTTIAAGASVSINVDQLTTGNTGNLLTLGGTTAFSGTGTLNVSGANNYTLRLNAVSAGGSSTTQTFNVASGNNLQVGAMTANTVYNVFTFAGAGNTLVDGSITQIATNRSLALVFNQTGAVTLSGSNNLRNNSNTSDNNNTYVNVNSGTTNFNSANAIFSNFAAPLNLNGGSIDNTSGGSIVLAGTHAISIASDFTYGGTNNLDLGNNTTTLNGSAGARTITTNGTATLTLSGVIGNGTSTGLTKAGTGTLTLSGVNTYTGATTINNGTLKLGVANALATGSAVTLGGGTLNLGGFSQAAFTNALTMTAGSTIDFGTHVTGLTLKFADSQAATWTGNLTLLNFTVGTDNLNFTSIAGGITSTQLGQITLAGYTATGFDGSGNVQFSAVPEPATYAVLAGLGVLGLAACRRRRNA